MPSHTPLGPTAILVLGLAATAATAQEGGPPPGAAGPPLSVQVLSGMGRAGLLGLMSSNERYGAVQSRVAGGRSMAAVAAQPFAPQDGYEDAVSEVLTPLSAIVRLNRGPSSTASFLRFSSENRWSDMDRSENDGYAVESDSEAHGVTASYLFAPDPTLLMGIGIMADANEVDLETNDGSIDIEWRGLRADLLKLVSPNWGVALRAAWFEETTETKIPLPFTTLETKQDSTRLYLQADALGSFSAEDLGWLPRGWALRPNIGAAWQKTWFEETENSLGAEVTGPLGKSSDEYGSVYAKAALETPAIGVVHPYFGLGIDHEFANSYSELTEESDYLNSFAGAAIQLSPAALINVNYARYDGFEGNRRKEAFVIAFGMAF
ncbi:hypothetical protein [Mangrovicoccus algicola]|uniref:Autotransporter domain-containing protein n=1 Tax=Mangrovicoccus algicola TaxID=2771008 RepID=A0A8J7CJF2_9RHOB|nr:hypothetical protein [Mangrovicoccus algicola]MBE3637606.1 hypothetical protein [Mangrovicoccus algicola]